MSHKPDQLQDASIPHQQMATSDEVYELTCHLQRSVRYHRARERFFEGWSNRFSFITLVAGSSVVASLLGDHSAIALASGGLVAVIQGLEQVFRLALKSKDHNSLASEFITLERIVTLERDLSQKRISELRAEVLTIEGREPPIKRYLDLICHNQVARSLGSDDVEVLKFWQRWFAQYLSGDSAMENRSS